MVIHVSTLPIRVLLKLLSHKLPHLNRLTGTFICHKEIFRAHFICIVMETLAIFSCLSMEESICANTYFLLPVSHLLNIIFKIFDVIRMCIMRFTLFGRFLSVQYSIVTFRHNVAQRNTRTDYLFILAAPWGMWNLSPLTKGGPTPPAGEARSLNQCTEMLYLLISNCPGIPLPSPWQAPFDSLLLGAWPFLIRYISGIVMCLSFCVPVSIF